MVEAGHPSALPTDWSHLPVINPYHVCYAWVLRLKLNVCVYGISELGTWWTRACATLLPPDGLCCVVPCPALLACVLMCRIEGICIEIGMWPDEQC